MDVGVRELKEHLSEYLERAAGGELICVTDRGRPRALLGPLPEAHRLDQGQREGWVRAGSGAQPAAVVRQKGAATIARVLDDDRE